MRPILYIKTYWKESMAGFAPLERPKGNPIRAIRFRSAEEAWELYSQGMVDFLNERRGVKARSKAILKAEEEKRKREEEWEEDWKEIKDAWRLDPRLTPEKVGTNVGHMTANSVQQLRIVALEAASVFKECLFEFLSGYKDGKSSEIEKGALGPEVFDHINDLKEQAIGKGNKRKTKRKTAAGTLGSMTKQDGQQSIEVYVPPPIASRPTMLSYTFMPPPSVQFAMMPISARRPTQAAWDVQRGQPAGARLAAAPIEWLDAGNHDDYNDDGAFGAIRDKLLAWADANIEEYHNIDPNASSSAEDDKTGLQQLHRMVQELTDKQKKNTDEGEKMKTSQVGDAKEGDGSGGGGWFGSVREKMIKWADGNMERLDPEKFAEQNSNKESFVNKDKSEQIEEVRESLLAWADQQQQKSGRGSRSSRDATTLAEEIRIKMLAWANDEDEATTKSNGRGAKKKNKKTKKDGDVADGGGGDDDYVNPRDRIKHIREKLSGWMSGLKEETRLRSAGQEDNNSGAIGNTTQDDTPAHYSSVDARGYTLSEIQNRIRVWDAMEAQQITQRIIRMSNMTQQQQQQPQQQQH